MAKSKIANNVKYNVVGRYMAGSTVSGYHILGSDGSQMKVSKNFLVRLIDKNKVDNCRVQMYNNETIIRGKGININDLPVFDERRGELKHLAITGETEKIGMENPNEVFGKLAITKRIMMGNSCVGYEVTSTNGIVKKLSRDKVIEMASERQIGNARVQRDNDKVILRGVGTALDKLPVIIVDANGKEIATIEEELDASANARIASHYEKATIKGYNKQPDKKEIPLIDVTIEDVMQIGKRKMVLRKDISKTNKETKRLTNISDVQSGDARLYVQAMINEQGNERYNIEEFISTIVKFGDTEGVIMRVANRNTGDTFDIRESSLEKNQINEKVVLAIMCCGIDIRYSINDFGLVSIQMKNASSERAYQFE